MLAWAKVFPSLVDLVRSYIAKETGSDIGKINLLFSLMLVFLSVMLTLVSPATWWAPVMMFGVVAVVMLASLVLIARDPSASRNQDAYPQ